MNSNLRNNKTFNSSKNSIVHSEIINFLFKNISLNLDSIQNFQKMLEEKNRALAPMDYLDDNFLSLSEYRENLNDLSSAYDSCGEDSHYLYN